MWLWPELRNLNFVWVMWLLGATVGIAIGLSGLRDLPWSRYRSPVDRQWLVRGSTVAIPYLAGTMAFRGVTTVDRYILSATLGDGPTGVYVFFIGIANSVVLLSEAGVSNVVLPDLVRAAVDKDAVAYRMSMRRLQLGVVTVGVLIAGSIYLFWSHCWCSQGKMSFCARCRARGQLLAAMVISAFMPSRISLYTLMAAIAPSFTPRSPDLSPRSLHIWCLYLDSAFWARQSPQ